MNITSFLITNFGVLSMTISLFLIFPILILTYVNYLKKDRAPLTLLKLQFLIVLLVLLILSYTILSAIISNLLVTVIADLIFFSLMALLIWWQYSELKCTNTEKIREINEIPILLCYDANKIYNAWFNPRKKNIHITKSLFDVLSEKEREAIIYHEVGHSENKFWLFITTIMRVLWLVLASFIVALIQLILLSNIDISLKINLVFTFVALLPIYAISFMTSSWINEHEADVHAMQTIGFKPTATALVKLHIYNNLRGYESFLKNLEFSDTLVLEEASYKAIFKEMMGSVIVYLNPEIIFNKPLPKTHPPLRLRLEKILNQYKSDIVY